MWKWLSNYPKIEDAHSTGTHRKQLVRRTQGGEERRVTLEALTVFRDGVAPEWEDPLNKAGYEVRLKFDRSAWPGQRHPFWEEVLLLVTGGTLPHADAVNGLRYVDKVRSMCFLRRRRRRPRRLAPRRRLCTDPHPLPCEW